MIVSRRWWALAGYFSLSSAVLGSQLRADEVDVAVEADSDAIELTIDADADSAALAPAKVDAPTAEKSDANSTGANPTHKQSSLIDINADDLPDATVTCFCLKGDDALLAGCQGPANEIRVFNADGKYSRSLQLPVTPEAINVAADGTILVAGDGKLLRLSADGEPLTDAEAPHADALRNSKKELREEVIEQHEQQKKMLPMMLQSYDQAISSLEDQLKNLDKDDAQRATLEETLKTYTDAKEQLKDQFGNQTEESELTEEKIAELIESSIKYKLTVASISATEDAVFLATRSPLGYGYDVWRMNKEFSGAEKIVTGLSGCCGQMDVQANDNGVFVAENSRKRVRRFDAEGKTICDWGKSSEGVDGFGSCCNPMNLAFGADGAVYTAEDTTGRIKRYSSDGQLLSVVGAADVVPGCKKVSIGVSAKGDRVYMLDITRNTVAVLSRVLPDPTEPIAEAEPSGSFGGGLLRLIGLGD